MDESNVDRLLKVRAEIDEELRRHKTPVTIFFTDVVGSAAYFSRYGDTSGFAMVQRHAELASRAVAEFGGRVIKTIGDSVMAEFPQPSPGVRAAMEIQNRLVRLNETLPERERRQLRIGINHGLSIRHDNDVFGDAVNLAARITKQTGPAQVLISRSVRDAIVLELDLPCSWLGKIALDGKREREDIFEVIWTDPDTYAALRRNLTAALARGDLTSPGLKLEELVQTAAPGASEPHALRRGGAVDAPAGIAVRYEILEEAGRGGMGIVYKTRDRETGDVVALKVLKLEIAADEAMQERFKNELRLARKITHRNVCRIHEFHRTGGTAWISMEFVEGQSLRNVLNVFETVPLRKGLNIASQICAGLKEAHKEGVVHRDLKPENLMIDRSGTVKIMDFGIARSFQASQALSGTGAAVGTPAYMSPEQAEGKPANPRSDIYALGLVLYEMLTGRRPFEGETPVALALKQIREAPRHPRELEPALPATIEAVILKCLEKDPSRRFQSAEELEAEIDREQGCLSSATMTRLEATPSGQWQAFPAERQKRGLELAWFAAALRRGWPWLAAGALAILLAVVLLDVAGTRQAPAREANSQSAPPPAPSKRGGNVANEIPALEITTKPAGAEVLVDGQKQPTATPFLLSLSQGEHKINVRKPGYQAADRTVVAGKNMPTSLHVDLVRRQIPAPQPEVTKSAAAEGIGRMVVQTQPQGAKISIDGNPTDFRSPVSLSLSSGNHTIAVQRTGFASETREVTVSKDQTSSLDIMLAPEEKKPRRFLFW